MTKQAMENSTTSISKREHSRSKVLRGMTWAEDIITAVYKNKKGKAIIIS